MWLSKCRTSVTVPIIPKQVMKRGSISINEDFAGKIVD